MYFLRILVLAATLGSNPLSISAIEFTTDKEQSIKAVIEGYQHNRKSFTFLACSLEVLWGTAALEEDAIAGTITSIDNGSSDYTIRWVYDEENMLCSTLCNKQCRSEIADEQEKLSCLSEVFLTDGKIGFSCSPRLESGQIVRLDNRDASWGPALTLFSNGISGNSEERSPYHLIKESLRRGDCYVVRTIRNEDKSLVVIRALIEKMGSDAREYYFDLNRGCLATRVDIFDGDTNVVKSQIVATQVKQTGDGRWYPHGVVRMAGLNNPRGPLRVRIMTAAKFDATNRPGPSEFTSPVPKNAVVHIKGVANSSRPMNRVEIKPQDLQDLLSNHLSSTRGEH